MADLRKTVPLGNIDSEAPIGIIKHPSHKALKGLIAGALSGMIELAVNFPTDYVKTQLQLDEKSSNRRYNGIADVVKQTVRKHGVAGLYRGLNVVIWNPKAAVRFGTFEKLKKFTSDDQGRLSSTNLLICGMLAGGCEAVVAVTPFESIKVKFMDDLNSPKRKYKGVFHGIRTIIKEHGIGGIYQGCTATVIKSMTSQGSRFFVIEGLKDWSRKRNPGESIPSYKVLLFGAIAGGVSVCLNAPVDVVKSRMQGLDAYKYHSTWHCTKTIFIKEGPAAFYKGFIPRMIKVPTEVAIVFTAYAKITEIMDKYW